MNLPNTFKQTQRVTQKEETEKYIPNERTELKSRKRTKQKRSNLSIKEFKTMVTKMLNKLGRRKN